MSRAASFLRASSYKGPMYLLLGLLLIVGIAFSMSHAFRAKALASPGNISGYAWSDTIGWISFNCLNDGSCFNSNETVRSPYGVSASAITSNGSGVVTGASNGPVVGYAWSDNVGWVSFGCGKPDTSNGGIQCSSNNLPPVPPTGSCPANDSCASIAGSAGAQRLVGWARACSVFMPVGGRSTCSGATKPMDQTGNWDGWISLSGSNYGVQLAGTQFSSFAWGNDILGWIDFWATCRGGGGHCGPGVYVGYPELTASCSVVKDPNDSTKAIWTAHVDSGGDGVSYAYKWYEQNSSAGQDYRVFSSGYSEVVAGDTFPFAPVKAVATRQYAPGYYNRFVEITSAGHAVLSRLPCSNGTDFGVHIGAVNPDFSVSADKDLAVDFLDTAASNTEASTTASTISVDMTRIAAATPLMFGRKGETVTITIKDADAATGGMKLGGSASLNNAYVCFVDPSLAASDPQARVCNHTYRALVPAPGFVTTNADPAPVYPKLNLVLSVKSSLASGRYPIVIEGRGSDGSGPHSYTIDLKVNNLGSAVQEF